MDRDLRQRERTAAQGGVEAETRLLRERLRAGELDAERLRLAVLLGDAAAAAALEVPGPAEAWTRTPGGTLKGHGIEACVRASVAAARRVIGAYLALCAGDRRPLHVLDAVDDWVLDPSEPRRQAVLDAGRPGPTAVAEVAGHHLQADVSAAQSAANAVWSLMHWAKWAGAAVRAPARVHAAEAAFDSVFLYASTSLAATALGPTLFVGWGLDEGARRAANAEVQRAVQAELLPWTLGRGDPVRARAAARSRA